MTLTRRQTIDACRGAPALFAGLPGNEIDLERLTDFVGAQALDAAIHVIDGTLEGILWVAGGAPGEAWFLEAEGGETIVPIEPEHELLRDIAASGIVSCYVTTIEAARALPPAERRKMPRPRPAPGVRAAAGADAIDTSLPRILRTPPAAADRSAAPPLLEAPPTAARPPGAPPSEAPPSEAPHPQVDAPPTPSAPAWRHHATLSAPSPPVLSPSVPEPEAPSLGWPARESRTPEPFTSHTPTPDRETAPEPATRPWGAMLAEVRVRVAKQRGKRLAERFIDALEAALHAYGGRLDGETVIAPPLSDGQWAAIVAGACAPVVAVAGRAWTDRTLEAAERTVRAREGSA
jgi:hypothetical protein